MHAITKRLYGTMLLKTYRRLKPPCRRVGTKKNENCGETLFVVRIPMELLQQKKKKRCDSRIPYLFSPGCSGYHETGIAHGSIVRPHTSRLRRNTA